MKEGEKYLLTGTCLSEGEDVIPSEVKDAPVLSTFSWQSELAIVFVRSIFSQFR